MKNLFNLYPFHIIEINNLNWWKVQSKNDNDLYWVKRFNKNYVCFINIKYNTELCITCNSNKTLRQKFEYLEPYSFKIKLSTVLVVG